MANTGKPRANAWGFQRSSRALGKKDPRWDRQASENTTTNTLGNGLSVDPSSRQWRVNLEQGGGVSYGPNGGIQIDLNDASVQSAFEPIITTIVQNEINQIVQDTALAGWEALFTNVDVMVTNNDPQDSAPADDRRANGLILANDVVQFDFGYAASDPLSVGTGAGSTTPITSASQGFLAGSAFYSVIQNRESGTYTASRLSVYGIALDGMAFGATGRVRLRGIVDAQTWLPNGTFVAGRPIVLTPKFTGSNDIGHFTLRGLPASAGTSGKAILLTEVSDDDGISNSGDFEGVTRTVLWDGTSGFGALT